jgi:hypothetical protein
MPRRVLRVALRCPGWELWRWALLRVLLVLLWEALAVRNCATTRRRRRGRSRRVFIVGRPSWCRSRRMTSLAPRYGALIVITHFALVDETT